MALELDMALARLGFFGTNNSFRDMEVDLLLKI